MKSGTRGGTILELMAVTAILATVLGMAVLSFRDLLPGIYLQGAVRDLVLDLQYARMRAIAQNQYYRVAFSEERETYVLERESGKEEGRWPGVIEGLSREFSRAGSPYHHPGVDLISVSQNPIFSPRGTVRGTTITLGSGNRRRVITVSSLGRVKVDQ